MNKIIEYNKKFSTILGIYGINNELRKQHFFTQLWHESKLNPISENMNYSATRLLQVFPKYFNKINVSGYANIPKKIGSRVYANRMGNGDEASGDGFLFRGRGFIQLTGKNNYILLSKDTRIDFIKNPDLLLDVTNSIIASAWFWQKNGLNALADKNDIKAVRKAVNGGYIGLKECEIIFKEVSKIIK